MTLRVVVADDEAVARSRLRRLLAAHNDVVIAAEAADGPSAVDAIVTHRPDVVFLDIRMPELDGFEVLAELDPSEVPAVVFVTAYSDHAPKAFDVRALDYLLKPYDPERLADTLERARERSRASEEGGRKILAAVEELAREQRALRQIVTQTRADDPSSAGGAPRLMTSVDGRRQFPSRILVSRRGHGVFVALAEVDYIESAGNYVRLHVGTTSHLLRETMNAIEGRLDPEKFFRIHRSRIVNMERIQEMQPWLNGEYAVVLQNGTRLTLSRGYREKLQERLAKTV
jgi:two-component system LytT family response regulator